MRKTLFFLFFLALSYYALWIFDPVLAWMYDVLTHQAPIEQKAAIDQVLNDLETITYEELEMESPERFSTEERKVCYGRSKDQLYQGMTIYKVESFQRYRYIVGPYRLCDFFSGSELFINSSGFPHLAKTQYIVLNKQLLYKLLELLQKLRDQGYDEQQIGINSGFRTPYYNEAVGGKVCSRHQMGDAVDIYVYDINRDGYTDPNDAKIVYKLLDEQIIQSAGGLGKYKSSSQVLHFDMRGFRARWHY